MPTPGAVSKGGYGTVSWVSCASAGNCVAGGYHEYGFGQRGFVAVEKNGRWGTAIEMPGPGALNKGHGAQVSSVSCASAGNCSAVGPYTDGRGNGQGFVVTEKNGVWGTAIEVPGLGALSNGDFYVQVNSVSCASAGNCVTGGTYPNGGGDGNGQGFVTVEKNGVWGTATGLPGLAALNEGGFARVTSLSCASAGNCAAGGYYGDHHGQQGFVADERNGRWGKAIAVPGLVALNKGKFAFVLSVSCASAANCAASGSWADADSHDIGGFVAVEENGVWGKAVDVPVGDGEVDSVSCTSAGNCLAGGAAAAFYTSAHEHAFLVEEQHGVWRKTIAVPGLAALGKGRDAGVNTVSCTSAGNCVAGGFYTDRHGSSQGFLAVERNGAWGTAIKVPGLAALTTGGNTGVGSVSCGSPGNCLAGGSYQGRHGLQGFVAVERNGRWGKATRVPGLAALNKGGQTQVLSVSCAPPGRCWASGLYSGSSGIRRGFVASEDNGVWGKLIHLPSLPAVNKGGATEVDSISCPAPGTCAAGGGYKAPSGQHQGFVTQGG